MLNAPCKDCPDRHYLCHSTCEKYLEFRRQKDALSDIKFEEKRRVDDYWGFLRDTKRIRKKRDEV